MKHLNGLAHIALYTNDLQASLAFYERLGGRLTDRAESKKPSGTNLLAMVQMPGFYLEIIEPHDGTTLLPEHGVFPHIAIEVDDIGAALTDIRAAGITSFRTTEPMNMPLFGGIRNIFFTGPSGELIELLQNTSNPSL